MPQEGACNATYFSYIFFHFNLKKQRVTSDTCRNTRQISTPRHPLPSSENAVSPVPLKQFLPDATPTGRTVSAADLLALADRCEHAGPAEQGDRLRDALDLVASAGSPVSHLCCDKLERVLVYTHLGAYESAVLALMPEGATFTGARLEDGSVIGQVALGAGTGAHSRASRVLAMGWLAALLRTLARQPVGTPEHGETLP